MLQRLSYTEVILLLQFTIGGHKQPSPLLHFFTDAKNKNYNLIQRLYQMKIAEFPDKACSYDWIILKNS